MRWKAVLAITVLFILTGGVVYAIRLPQLQITHIQISGIRVVAEDAVRARMDVLLSGNYAILLPRRFILFSQDEAIITGIKNEFPVIENVEVIKQYPDLLIVKISERKLFAILCNDLEADDVAAGIGLASTTEVITEEEEKESRCAYIDKGGFAYDNAPSSSGMLIVRMVTDAKRLEIPSQVFKKGLIEKMEYLAEKLPVVAGERILRFEFMTRLPREFRIKTASGFRIYINSEDDIDKVLKILKRVLDEEVKERKGRLEYVDVRFGNKVFFKMK